MNGVGIVVDRGRVSRGISLIARDRVNVLIPSLKCVAVLSRARLGGSRTLVLRCYAIVKALALQLSPVIVDKSDRILNRAPHSVQGDILIDRCAEVVVISVQLPLDEGIMILGRIRRLRRGRAFVDRLGRHAGTTIGIEGYGNLRSLGKVRDISPFSPEAIAVRIVSLLRNKRQIHRTIGRYFLTIDLKRPVREGIVFRLLNRNSAVTRCSGNHQNIGVSRGHVSGCAIRRLIMNRNILLDPLGYGCVISIRHGTITRTPSIKGITLPCRITRHRNRGVNRCSDRINMIASISGLSAIQVKIKRAKFDPLCLDCYVMIRHGGECLIPAIKSVTFPDGIQRHCNCFTL